MERRPRSPTGRNAPSKTGPKSGLESGFRKRAAAKKDGNFSTRDGKEGFRADDGGKRSYPDKPKRDFGDRPARSFDDKPKRDYADKPKRDYGDRPDRGGNSERPARSYADRPKRDFGDKPARSYDDRPKRDFSDRPKRDFGDRPARSFDDKPKRDYGDRPDRGGNSERPARSYSDRPKRDFGDKPQRSFGDKPKRSFDDRPKRDFGDRPKKSFGGQDREERAPRFSGPRITASLYGIHAVRAALTNPDRRIKAIFATEETVTELAQALESALENGLILPDITVVEKESLNRALPRDAVHQGVALDLEPLEETFLADIIRKAEVKKKSVVVLLDQVTDPHNIGAILRSACAFGADAIIVQSRNAPELSGLITKAASGAAEYVPLVYETNLSRALDVLKEGGFFALALDERGQNIVDAPAYEKTVLVMGAEGPGLRQLVKNHCDLTVKLPTSGPISSLNVSNAAAIALFAITAKA